jgi:hypothetical protein
MQAIVLTINPAIRRDMASASRRRRRRPPLRQTEIGTFLPAG